MIKFDSEGARASVRRKQLYNKINIAFITAFLIFGLVAAVCTQYLGELGVWFLCIAGVLLIALILYNVLFVFEAGRQVKRQLATVLADGFYQNEELLKDGENIDFEVSYSGDTLTVMRTDGGNIDIDLTGLKPLPSLYSCAGTYVLEFLQAYYAVNFKERNYENVRVTDRTTKRIFEFIIVDGGNPVCTDAKNYFIKNRLVK